MSTPVPAGTLLNLRVKTDVGSFVGTSVTVTVVVSSTTTGITCTVTGVTDSCSDLVNTVAVTAGDTVGFQLDETGIDMPDANRLLLQLQLP
ncbi:MAG: hypothetical protein R2708_28565 [Vicinamibacterales bacterium]